MTIDLSSLDASGGTYRMQVRHPATRLPIPDMYIDIVGVDSAEYQEARMSQQNKRLKDTVDRRGAPPTVAEIDQDAMLLLAACTKSWSGILLDGQELPCTQANVLKVYQRFPWLREQVDYSMGDRANFLPRS